MREQIAYFDTNVYLDLAQLRSGIGAKHVRALRKAIRSNQVSVALSAFNIDELLQKFPHAPKTVRDEFDFMLTFTGSSLLLKEPRDILTDAVAAYGAGTAATSPFTERTDILTLVSEWVHSDSPNDVLDLLRFLGEAKRQQQDFTNGMAKMRADVLTHLEENPERRLTVDEYMEGQAAETQARWLAERVGLLRECEAAGISDLLWIRPVRLWVGHFLLLVDAQAFDRRQPVDSDCRDSFHALCSAAADVFVTHDARLSSLLSRIRVPGWRVTDLRSFLQPFV